MFVSKSQDRVKLDAEKRIQGQKGGCGTNIGPFDLLEHTGKMIDRVPGRLRGKLVLQSMAFLGAWLSVPNHLS
jgi:hypothetical protein